MRRGADWAAEQINGPLTIRAQIYKSAEREGGRGL